MNVHVLVFAYALDVRPLVNAVMADGVTLHLYVHSDRPDVVEACHEMTMCYSGVRLYDYRTNRGTELSFNDGVQIALAEHAEAIVIPNDDITISWTDFRRLAEGCVAHPEVGLITCNGYNVSANLYHNLGFCCFGINRIAIDTAGYLDENFWPAYFSDTDYLRRCKLLGVPMHCIGDTDIIHQGSATLKAVPMLQSTYPRNEAYFRQKHGGVPGAETFLMPFGDPALSWAIPAERRSNPYPDFVRAR